jgi:hypothetical protein
LLQLLVAKQLDDLELGTQVDPGQPQPFLHISVLEIEFGFGLTNFF